MRLASALLLLGVQALPEVDHSVSSLSHKSYDEYHKDNTECKADTKLKAQKEWAVINDGSHYQMLHKNNLDCGWHITAPMYHKIEYTFTRFATQDPVCPKGQTFNLVENKITQMLQDSNHGVDIHSKGTCSGGGLPTCVEGVKFYDTPADALDPSKVPEQVFCGDVYITEFPWKCDYKAADGSTLCAKNHVTDMTGASGTNANIDTENNFGWDHEGKRAKGDGAGTATHQNFGADANYCVVETFRANPNYKGLIDEETMLYLERNCDWMYSDPDYSQYCIRDEKVSADMMVGGECLWQQQKVGSKPIFEHMTTPGMTKGGFKLWTQQSNSLYVNFTTDATVADYGWELKFRAVRCTEFDQCDCQYQCTNAPTPAPTPEWAGEKECVDTKCKYTVEKGHAHTMIYHGYLDKSDMMKTNFHCEHLPGWKDECKCTCHEKYECEMTHHHASGEKTDYKVCQHAPKRDSGR